MPFLQPAAPQRVMPFRRAWALREIASAIAPHPAGADLRALADHHFSAAEASVAGDYMGEHWLASFALLALLAPR